MGIVLMIIGFGWACFGVASMFAVDWSAIAKLTGTLGTDQYSDIVSGWIIIIHFILYILPGLLIGGIGIIIRNQNKAIKLAIVSASFMKHLYQHVSTLPDLPEDVIELKEIVKK